MKGNRVGCIAMVDSTWGNSGRERGGSRRKGSSNRGEEAGEGRLWLEGGCRFKRRSAGREAMQWLVLLLLCTAGGADPGGSWKRQSPAGGKEVGWGNSRGSECWGGGSWQQASGAVTRDSWQNSSAGGSGVSSGGARGGVWSGCSCLQHIGRAEAGGSWQKQLPVGGGGGSRGGGSGGGGWSGGSWLLGAEGAIAGGCWQEQILVGEGDSSGGCSNGTMGSSVHPLETSLLKDSIS